MSHFLAAQACDPFDPAPMLILADTLEEAGDPAGAAVLRGLVKNGTPSLHALALEATLCSVPWRPDLFDTRYGDGRVFGDRFIGSYGAGDGFGSSAAAGAGYGSGDGHGYKDGQGYRGESGTDDDG